MQTVSELLAEIRRRPGMYIGQRCPHRLHLFLQGWLFGKEAKVPDAQNLQIFGRWVANRFNIRSNHSWADIITFYSESNVEAFEMFWELWDEFQEKLEKGELDAN